MLKKKMTWILLFFIVVIIGGGFAYYQTQVLTDDVVEEPAMQTSTVRLGDLEIIATGAGTIIPASEIDLSFGTSGNLIELNVSVGDVVQAGDILAQLGDTARLEASMTSAKLNVITAQQTLDGLYDNHAVDLASAYLELADVQLALQDAEYYLWSQQAGNRENEDIIASLEANLIIAEDRVANAQQDYNEVANRPDDDLRRARALAALEDAKANRDSILRQLNWFYSGPSDVEQMALDAEVALAEARLQEVLVQVETLEQGPDPNEVELAEARLANELAQLKVAEEEMSGATIFAPIDGTILTINVDLWENVGTGTIMTIANLKEPLLQINLDETDYDKIKIGDLVEVTFDAIPDQIFTGYVVGIDPGLVKFEGVSTISAIVQLDSTGEDAFKLPIGSNANVDIISARTENAVLVPIEALRQISSTEYAVFVMEDGEPKLRMVEVGLIDVTYAEVLSGLTSGEVVTTGIVETE